MGEDHLDRIYVRDLACRCILGINPEEREKTQDVVINVVLYADLRRACATDDINDTVDYKGIKQQILQMAEGSSFYLVERLAEEVARIALGDPRVRRVEVSIDKPGALRFARSVAVAITRER